MHDDPEPENHNRVITASENSMATTQVEYLTTEETAALIRTPVATLYRWRHEGSGPRARKIGKRLLYRLDEVIEWADSRAA